MVCAGIKQKRGRLSCNPTSQLSAHLLQTWEGARNASAGSRGGFVISRRRLPSATGALIPFTSIVSLLFLFPGSACAADLADAERYVNPHLFVGLASLVSIGLVVNLFLSIWHKVRPEPPYQQQFAPREHKHAEYVKKEDCEKHIEQLATESRHKVKHDTINREALQRQVDHLSQNISSQFRRMEERNEERASLVHTRINGISEPLNQLVGKFENHIQEHNNRAGGN